MMRGLNNLCGFGVVLPHLRRDFGGIFRSRDIKRDTLIAAITRYQLSLRLFIALIYMYFWFLNDYILLILQNAIYSGCAPGESHLIVKLRDVLHSYVLESLK